MTSFSSVQFNELNYLIERRSFFIEFNKPVLVIMKHIPLFPQAYGLRGYLEDRVNRLIGYAIVRQVQY